MAMFSPKTVDQAVANLVKAVEGLNAVGDAQRALAESAQQQVLRQQQVRDEARAEAERADRIAGKIEELVA